MTNRTRWRRPPSRDPRQGCLFDLGGGPPRSRPRPRAKSTSRRAAEAAAPHAETLSAELVCPIVDALLKSGQAALTDRERPTRSGRPAAVIIAAQFAKGGAR